MLLALFKKGDAAVFKRLFRGGSVIVCRAFSTSRKSDLVVMEGKKILCPIYQCVGKKSFPIYESSTHQ